ncbi:MAG: SpoIID/LytB domain-containing protein [Leptolyngbyaceae cyanobacterium SM2_5_2]|nr:SpoIID/LytB domain-containing protein [Leptolyngbyaceae cyanobacterium SM2_5_2]
MAGVALVGLALTQVPASPLSVLRSPAPTNPLGSSLWGAAGPVRQSNVDLYRARRLLIQSGVATTAPSTATSSTAASSTTQAQPSKSSTGTANPTQSDVPAGAGSKTVPQPQTPPSPAVATSFDPSKTIDTNLEMRVAIAKGVSSLEVATSADGYLMDLNGQNYCNMSAQKSFVLRPQDGGMAFGSCQLTNTAWLEAGEGGYVFVGDNWYKGRVLLMQSGNAITAVNFVLLHDYLSSVVGSEMYVNWPLESLKAQAVAARSYALVHHVRHANRSYDLDNTQRYQAYLGIGKETNTTQAAVAATTGEFISYNGGIVESLYAASDAIVEAAHGGNGMSQTGAMEMASQGHNYTEILGNYYPGTSLSRLVVQ